MTLLVYMNGSDLESEASEATTDITEMLAAGYCDNVNVVIETLGTKKWNPALGIASDRSQIYKVEREDDDSNFGSWMDDDWYCEDYDYYWDDEYYWDDYYWDAYYE